MFDLPLSEARFDRASDRRTDGDWLSEAWARGKALLVSPKSATPVSDGRLVLRDASDAPSGTRRFLGLVDGVPYFALTAEPDGENWQTLREFGASADELAAGLVVTAVALEQWHQRHPRCPLCGSETDETNAGWTRTCRQDGSEHFPRTDPAVIMLVHDGANRALLGRGHQWGDGRFSTLAGFVEPGESIEAAVAREVREEVGIAIRDIRYLASQPWPFPSSLMIGFHARVDGDDSLTIDPEEIAEAGWFTREEVGQARDWIDGHLPPIEGTTLRGIPPRLSISRYLIDRWLDGDV